MPKIGQQSALRPRPLLGSAGFRRLCPPRKGPSDRIADLHAFALSTSGGPRPCWPSCKPHDWTSPHVREHRLYLLARALTEPVRAQPVPDHALEPADGGLRPGSFCVPGGLLPRPAAPLGDELEVAVALGWRAL